MPSRHKTRKKNKKVCIPCVWWHGGYLREKEIRAMGRTASGVKGIEVTAIVQNGSEIESLENRIVGRFTADKVVNPKTKEIVELLRPEVIRSVQIYIAGTDGIVQNRNLNCNFEKQTCHPV